jgi:hypothetical protein
MVDKSTVDSCLQGISLPADGHEIVDCASGNGCPPDVISQIASLQSRTYGSKEELLCKLGNSEYCYASVS